MRCADLFDMTYTCSDNGVPNDGFNIGEASPQVRAVLAARAKHAKMEHAVITADGRVDGDSEQARLDEDNGAPKDGYNDPSACDETCRVRTILAARARGIPLSVLLAEGAAS